jgi:glycosyltransferase involved in cell wall biosynthesis
MNILICHERFIFRFGADRALILLGKGLSDLGHKVTFMGNRFDRETIEPFAAEVITSPVESSSLTANESTSDWLQTEWNHIFQAGNVPDVVFVGGWPYVSAISFFRTVCRQVIYVDCGVVPNDGYPKKLVRTLEKLRALRKQHLPDASFITTNSHFTAESQSRPDSQGKVPIQPILLGADHFDSPKWQPAQFKTGVLNRWTPDVIHSLKLQGKKILLALGRWEPGCYKNSDAALEVLEGLISAHPECILLILEQASNVQIPDHLQDRILPIGFPDDQELFEIMKQVDLGLSPSLWEGFNLPLAEMQWAGRPVLAFNVGAHPEVIAHPWYLCHDVAEMTAKAAELLAGRGPDKQEAAIALERFRNYFRWDRFVQAHAEILQDAIGSAPTQIRLPFSLPPSMATSALNDEPVPDSFKQVLYPGCLCSNWQMNDSERLTLTALLARHQPYCSIEVGTYYGGSLSLISQYSKIVFSIDIDETIPTRLSFPNVSFLTGSSHVILPHLLRELDQAGISVDFVLIDGDHSTDAVKRDIRCLLHYVPKKPLFVALHDSFNPGCRQGMLEAGWEESPYCHWIDLDLVPGKMANGELWGGLAVACFLPTPRYTALQIHRSAQEMFELLQKRQKAASLIS